MRMDKPTTGAAKEPSQESAQEPAQKPAHEPATPGAVNIELFAQNLARMIEEGGKALAAYMKPREDGTIKGELSEDVTDMVKTVGQVAEYWLSDPQRAVELQASLGRAYLDLWASSPAMRLTAPAHKSR